jgi:flagellar hook assembly protein FlgD
LSQNYPNPFRTMTGIRYQLPKSGNVTIAIYNVFGQRIKTLVNEPKDVGYYTVHWDGRSQDGKQVSNGVYFCRMIAGEYTSVKKILLMH